MPDDVTTELAASWLLKARRDLAAARKLASGDEPFLDAAVYHCQQAAEKALKGLLVYHNQRFEKVHNLQTLLMQTLSIAPRLVGYMEEAETLTPYATAFRYPGELLEPDQAEFETALVAARRILDVVLSMMPDSVGRKE